MGLVDVARRFYVLGQTQQEIARAWGVDASTISRALKRARATGVVRIEIRAPHQLREKLSQDLAQRFGLQNAVVVAGEGDPDAVAEEGARFFGAQLRGGVRVGLSWGRMLAAVMQRIVPGAAANLVIAQLLGGVSGEGAGIQGHELARLLAIACPESRVHYLHAPLLVDSPKIRTSMLQDRSIRASLEAAARSELALVGIGNLTESAPLVRYGHLSSLDRRRLRKAGAVGDVCARFFTAEGQPVRELDHRLLAVDWETLTRMPSVVAAAAGPDKVEATLGALRGGVVSSLVTDEWTAEEILRRAGS
jgi:DNA-binding transcriptional regulator LsrR (DeoR family)